MIREATVHRFVILLVAATAASAAALADDHAQLHGTYAVTGTASCIQTSASIGFNSNFMPNGPSGFFTSNNIGVRVFHADGTGTVNVRDIGVTAPPFAGAGSGATTYQFTYTISEDGRLSTAVVPGTYKGTPLTGPRAGQTVVEEGPPDTGLIGEGARTIELSVVTPGITSITYSNGDRFVRVCNSSHVLTRISDDDR
jgi:hypothetical protein